MANFAKGTALDVFAAKRDSPEVLKILQRSFSPSHGIDPAKRSKKSLPPKDKPAGPIPLFNF
jgi:hypothetical protein